MSKTEKIEVSICKGSRAGDAERFSLKHLPIPSGVRRGVYERVFVSRSDVAHILQSTQSVEVEISAAAQREL